MVKLHYLTLLATPILALPADLVERTTDVCTTGIYAELAPVLKNYPIAVAFCKKYYPVTCPTSKKRDAVPEPEPALELEVETQSLEARTDSKTAWVKALKQTKQVVKTMCSCILPKCPPVVVTPTCVSPRCFGGKSFTIVCDQGSSNGNTLTGSSGGTLQQCAEGCAADSRCNQFYFAADSVCYTYAAIDPSFYGAETGSFIGQLTTNACT